MRFTFGLDPEFMIASPDGRMVSAIPRVRGTKDHHEPLGRHSMHHDNVMAECAVAFGRTRDEAIKNIRDCLHRLAGVVRPDRLVCRAAHYYEPEQLKDKEAGEAFCLPEFCAYTMKPHKGNRSYFRRNTLRTAGGHVHLGTELTKVWYGGVSLVRMMDLFVGIPSVLICHDRSESLRKALYGRAGRYRQPKHGVEYRSLGNFWLASPKLAALVYDLSDFVVRFVAEGRHKDLWVIDEDKLRDVKVRNRRRFDEAKFHHCVGYDADRLREAIDCMDRGLAWEFFDFSKKYLPSGLQDRVMDCAMPTEYDLYEEWQMN